MTGIGARAKHGRLHLKYLALGTISNGGDVIVMGTCARATKVQLIARPDLECLSMNVIFLHVSPLRRSGSYTLQLTPDSVRGKSTNKY